LTVGFLAAGPVCGMLSDRYGARAFATGGLAVVALSMVGLMVIPVDFSYWVFAALLLLNGIGSGMFSSPNTSAVMSSVPAEQRGAASGMRATFLNSGSALSIGIFFTFMIVGLAGSLPGALRTGLTGQGVPSSVADRVAGLPPVGSLFAAFLGFNPIQQLLGPSGVLTHLPAANVATLTGKEFFPQLISGPFQHGLFAAFLAALIMTVVGAVASALQGKEQVADLVEPIGAPAPGPGMLPISAPAGTEEEGVSEFVRDFERDVRTESAAGDRSARGDWRSGADYASNGAPPTEPIAVGGTPAPEHAGGPEHASGPARASDQEEDIRDPLLRALLDDPASALRAAANLREVQQRLGELRESMEQHRAQLAEAMAQLRKAGLSQAQVVLLAGGSQRELAELLDDTSALAPRPTCRPSPTVRPSASVRSAPTAPPRPTPSVRPTPSPHPRNSGQWEPSATEASTPPAHH
jgi:hypothetical protein